MTIHLEKTSMAAVDSQSTLLRIALFGDVEPKPEPVFPNFAAAVDAVNALHSATPVDFTICVGDLVHRGSLAQYQEATRALRNLQTPFYSIMGNEELGGGRERFFQYAAHWNEARHAIPDTRYVVQAAGFVFIFVSAEGDGKNLSPTEVAWTQDRLQLFADRPAFLITHAAAPGAFPSADARAMRTDGIESVLAAPNLVAAFFGHSHMDVDAYPTCRQDSHGVYHIHAPGIERTKLGHTHTPRIRLVTITAGMRALIQTFNLATQAWEEAHTHSFDVKIPKARYTQ